MIELRQIAFSYAGQETGGLRDFSLTIGAGECVLLCGRSGCGKTTVTRLVNGLIPRFYAGELSGQVFINGRDIAEYPMYEIAERVGSVFQNPRTQFFNTDSDSEIAFGLENRACPPEEMEKRLEAAARELEMRHLRGRSLHELSGGEKQKIAFASVYAMDPDIYLLDEPSSNLDLDAIEDLKQRLALVKRQGKTILIAEHRLYYLMELADRIVYMEQGRIAGIYTPEQFRALPEARREEMGLRATDLKKVHPGAAFPAQAEPLLELKGVSLRYRKRPVLENINFKAGAGEIIGIVGHNGAGKTTFSRALCGLHGDSDGRFIWRGRPQREKERLKRSYMVMQDVNYELFAESVRAECAFGIRAASPELVERTLEKLGLSPYQDKHPNTLSGGQKQRVAVAVSMICGKELLVFDEPTSGLDFDSMAQAAGLIRELSAAGKIIFIVTHDYEFICRTCSRVLQLDHGEQRQDFPVSSASEERLRRLFSL